MKRNLVFFIGIVVVLFSITLLINKVFADGGGFPTSTPTPSPTFLLLLPSSTPEPTSTPIPLNLSDISQPPGVSDTSLIPETEQPAQSRSFYPLIYVLCVGLIIIGGVGGIYVYTQQKKR